MTPFDNDPLVRLVNSDAFGQIGLIIFIGLPILAILTLFLTHYFSRNSRDLRKFKRKNKRQIPRKMLELNAALQEPVNHQTYHDVIRIEDELVALITMQPWRIHKKFDTYRKRVDQYEEDYKKFEEQEKRREKEEQRRREKEKADRERKEEQKFWHDVESLADEFREQGHAKSIPEEYRYYDKKRIEEAIHLYKKEKKEQEEWIQKQREIEENEREIQSFVWKHKGLPSNYHKLDHIEKEQYNTALKQLKNGELKEIIKKNQLLQRHEERLALLSDEEYENLTGEPEEGKERASELLENKFYYLDELTPQETSFLIKFYDYKKGKISLGDGFKSVIFHKTGRETDKHYLMKQVIARIHPESKIEYSDKWGNEIDILFTEGRKKIAVEIETGSNKTNHTIEKISKLRKRYAKVIVVTNRKHLPKYKVHADNQTVFVETPKNAIQKVQELVS